MIVESVTNQKGNTDLFVTYNNKYSIEFANITEYKMMNFISPVEIWTNTENSIQLFSSSKIKFEYQYTRSCYYLEKSDIIVLITPCYETKYVELLYVLFDFNEKVFTTINATNFDLTELENNIVRLDLHFRYCYDSEVEKQISIDNGKLIDLSKLDWHDITKIDKLCKLSITNNTL